jgi:hypothetical protein
VLLLVKEGKEWYRNSELDLVIESSELYVLNCSLNPASKEISKCMGF